jgi:hypothetical protein
MPLMSWMCGHTRLAGHDVVHNMGAEACTVMVPEAIAAATRGT